MHQIQPQKEKRYTACSRRLDKIKQVFFALQAVYFCDDYHRTLDSKCAERQHEINRPAAPACEVIPEHRQDRDKKQLPHLIFEDVAAFGVSHCNDRPRTQTAGGRKPEPVQRAKCQIIDHAAQHRHCQTEKGKDLYRLSAFRLLCLSAAREFASCLFARDRFPLHDILKTARNAVIRQF